VFLRLALSDLTSFSSHFFIVDNENQRTCVIWVFYSIFDEGCSIRRYDNCPIQETHVTKSCGIVNNKKCFVGGCLFHLQGPSNPWATEDKKSILLRLVVTSRHGVVSWKTRIFSITTRECTSRAGAPIQISMKRSRCQIYFQFGMRQDVHSAHPSLIIRVWVV
jgi:hypothetical protein